jgi:ubiquinone/menaquinone biosynthesis C-methylase UbiE
MHVNIQDDLPETIRSKIGDGELLSLELGCGARKRHPEAVGIDLLPAEGVDIVGDICTVLRRFPDKCIAAVYSYHCFEHLDNLDVILNEIGRVMVKKAPLIVVVPHFSNPYYFSDSTHRQPFGMYTFSYFAKDRLFSRRCPKYQRQIKFEIKNVKLIFKSPRPFYVRFGLKKIAQTLFNMNIYLQELYEENFCWLIPCYEIRFEMERI